MPPRALSWLGFVGFASSAVGGWASPILSAHRHSGARVAPEESFIAFLCPQRSGSHPGIAASSRSSRAATDGSSINSEASRFTVSAERVQL